MIHDLTPILVIGFIVLGIYKLTGLFVKKQERLTLLEKLPLIFENKENGGKINLPELSFGRRDYGSRTLRIALLLVGVGLGCIVAFFLEYYLFDAFLTQNFRKLDNWLHIEQLLFVLYFSFITIFGGLGLLIAYLMEQKQGKKDE
ncbi:hypothetical protein AGMMS49525_01850 [Bacteroidia bacterium]|nr:hypothetical protein AGMMS49525_01850 [Bacteroidia bacterium]